MKKWYIYDVNKGNLFLKMVYADQQPKNSTDIPPYTTVIDGVEYPIATSRFNLQKNQWEGYNSSIAETEITSLLTKQIIALQLSNQQQEKTMAALTKQIMMNQSKGEVKSV